METTTELRGFFESCLEELLRRDAIEYPGHDYWGASTALAILLRETTTRGSNITLETILYLVLFLRQQILGEKNPVMGIQRLMGVAAEEIGWDCDRRVEAACELLEDANCHYEAEQLKLAHEAFDFGKGL